MQDIPAAATAKNGAKKQKHKQAAPLKSVGMEPTDRLKRKNTEKMQSSIVQHLEDAAPLEPAVVDLSASFTIPKKRRQEDWPSWSYLWKQCILGGVKRCIFGRKVLFSRCKMCMFNVLKMEMQILKVQGVCTLEMQEKLVFRKNCGFGGVNPLHLHNSIFLFD